MASDTKWRAPSLFLRNATGLVKGWSGVRRFRLFVLLGQPRHAGHVLQPGDLRVRPGWDPILSALVLAGGRDDVPGRRLRGADRGHAAGRRRLRLADPDPRRRPGRRRRGRRRRAHRLPCRERGRPRATPSRSSPASPAWSSAGPSAALQGGIGFVLAARAGGSSLPSGRRSTAASSTSSSSSRSRRWSSPPTACSPSSARRPGRSPSRSSRSSSPPALVALGMAGYARIQRWCLYLGLIGLGHHVRPHARLVAGRLQGRLRSSEPEPVRYLRTPTTRRSTTRPPTTHSRPLAAARLRARRPVGYAAAPRHVPFMMFWILYPNWGSTLYGEVRGSGDFRKVLDGMLGGLWVTVALASPLSCSLRRRSAGTSSTRRTPTSSTTRTATSTAAPTIPIWGYPPMLASYLIDNHIFQIGSSWSSSACGSSAGPGPSGCPRRG